MLCRFTPEQKAKRNPLCHIPFGYGPRNCIGSRFALMEAKMALIEILKGYHFVRVPETEVSGRLVVQAPFTLCDAITGTSKSGSRNHNVSLSSF